ncbi:CorA family divalent cation transporter [uncultured Sphingomonas sp.]|uniref:CorA family divalent cation transporter n=1 Tax=uncultured Sphingomonas sp. TaxID=158754 RepID=UPI0035CC9338
MTIVATSLYRDGYRDCDAASDARIACARAPNDFVWIDLVDPTLDDLAVLQPAYGLSALSVVDVLRGAGAPVFEDHGDHWFVGMPAAVSPPGMEGCDRIAALMGPGYVITIAYGLRSRGHRSVLDRNERSKIDASDILYAHLSNAIAGYEHAIEAIEEEVLSFAHQSLGPPTTPESYRLASRLRLRLKSIIEVLDDLGDVQEDIERYTGERAGVTLHASPLALSCRVQSLMQSADLLLNIVDFSVDYRDCKTAHGQRHRWTLPSMGMVISLIILVAIQGELTGPVGHSSGLLSPLAIVGLRIGLVLCTSIVLLNHMSKGT